MIRLHEPTFGEDEIQAAVDVLRSTWVTQGSKVDDLERAFSPERAVACNSGSSANLLAIASLKAMGKLKDGDEVIVSALSWSTTVWPLIQANLIPVIVDCDIETFNINPVAIEDAIGPKTKAIMPVHVYGNPCDMDAVSRLCAAHGLLLIEDCCEAMGALYGARRVGSYGDMATFSFYFSHHITTMEGGMVLCKSDEADDMLRIQRSHGWTRDVKNPAKYLEQHPGFDPRFLFVDLGFNLRMTELSAAMGLCQLPKLEWIVERRKTAWRLLRKFLGGHDYLSFQDMDDGGSPFGFAMLSEERKAICDFLNANEIETRPIICGNIALQPAMKKYAHKVSGELPNATRVMREGFSIGCHQAMRLAKVERVAEVMKDYACGR